MEHNLFLTLNALFECPCKWGQQRNQPEGVVVDDEEGELRGAGERGWEGAGEVVEGDANIDQGGVGKGGVPSDPLRWDDAQAVALDIQGLHIGVGCQAAGNAACSQNWKNFKESLATIGRGCSILTMQMLCLCHKRYRRLLLCSPW